MLKAPHGKASGSKAVGLLIASFVFLLVGYSLAGAITISPHKLILNSQGNAEDVQAIVPMFITSGYMFTTGEATLEFDGIEVAVSISMRYCYVDDNLLIGFDKEELLQNPDVIAMAGTTVTARVEGSFTATNADGDTYTKDFSGTDQVEIVAPGKNYENK